MFPFRPHLLLPAPFPAGFRLFVYRRRTTSLTMDNQIPLSFAALAPSIERDAPRQIGRDTSSSPRGVMGSGAEGARSVSD
jgi:hypothetical protein